MPTTIDLGRKLKTKYPGQYDDLSDEEVGKRVKSKFPGVYDDFTDAKSEPAKKDAGLFRDINAPAYDLSNEKLSVKGVAKGAVNAAKSLVRFGKDTIQFLNPIETAKKLKDIPGEIADTALSQVDAQRSQQQAARLEQQVKQKTGKAPVAKNTNITSPGFMVKNFASGAYQSTIPPAAQKVIQGKGTEALQSVAEDPYQLAPAFLALKGGLERTRLGETKAGKAVDTTISKTGQAGIKTFNTLVKNPAVKTGGALKTAATGLASFGTSQATGLNPKTIRTIIENPKEFSIEKMSTYSREGIGQEVHSAITNRIESLSETGKGYESLRKTNGVVSIPKGEVQGVLAKYGIKLDPDGKIIRDAETSPLKPGDLTAIEDFVAQYGNESVYSNNGFLNARKALSNMAEFDATKSDLSNIVSRDLRSTFDAYGKNQIKGLTELDAKYGPEVKLLKDIKRDYLKPDGTFKDGALTKIANLTNEGRQQILGRLEKIQPGISQKITVLKAIEDINNASGQKVGTYARGAITGGALFTGNPALIVASILAYPKMATQILRAYGKLRGVSDSTIKAIINKTNNVKLNIKDNVNSESHTSIKNEYKQSIEKGTTTSQTVTPQKLKYFKANPKKLVRVNNYQNPGYAKYLTPDVIKRERMKLQYRENKDKPIDMKSVEVKKKKKSMADIKVRRVR